MSSSALEESIASHETPGTKFFPLFVVTAELETEADARISHYPANKRSATLPLLHIVQHKFGYISAAAIEWVAAKLDLEPIKVLEVVTFYPGFRQSAPGRFHIRVCRTLSCAMGGSHELMERLCELTGIDRSTMDSHHHPIAVSPCGNFSVEFAECLASCGTAPVCMVNDDFHEGVAAGRAEELLAQYAKKD
ncbi:MAG: NAD(P)H-dependent oxidoreductase subunit E [Luteolibacter sp.]|jgi:NADH-quinone oxidoreductase subunit E|nr:NAD(P)H-dependent oxidoreductase subunit E [Luteolibacter sp.]